MEYLTLKAEADALEEKHRQEAAEMAQKLTEARERERDAAVEKVRVLVGAFDVKPEELYEPHALAIKPKRGPGRPRGSSRTRGTKPVSHAWKGKIWRGVNGVKPQWYIDALKAGVSDQQMRDEATKINAAPR